MFNIQDYIGNEILVTTISAPYKDGVVYHRHVLNENDTVIKSIKENYDGSVRVWFPNTVGTCDYKPSRLNVRVSKEGDIFLIKDITFG